MRSAAVSCEHPRHGQPGLKIEPDVVESMLSWPGHRRAAMVGGFSVDQSVFLPVGDRAGIERLVGYMTRCPFSLSRLVILPISSRRTRPEGACLPESLLRRLPAVAQVGQNERDTNG